MNVESRIDFKALRANRNIIARSYWRKRLAGLEPTNYFQTIGPVAGHPGIKARPGHAEHTLRADGRTHEALTRLARSDKAVQVTLLAALGILARKYSSAEEVCLFTPLYREDGTPEAEDNAIPVRIGNFSRMSFAKFLIRLKEDLVQDFRYGDYPAKGLLQPGAESRSGLSVTGMLLTEIQDATAFMGMPPGLLFSFSVRNGLTLTIRYAAREYDPESVGRISEDYFALLLQLLENSGMEISDGSGMAVRKPVRSNIAAGSNSRTYIPLAEKRKYYPVSFAQRRIIYSQQMFKVGTSYNSTSIVRVEGALDLGELIRVFTHLIDRHEVFRTSFHFIDGAPVQKISASATLDMDISDLREKVAGKPEKEVDLLVREMIDKFVRPFDLSKAPLFKAGLIRLSGEKWILLFDMDHTISDGVSQGIISREFLSLFDHKVLPDIGVQYKDFTLWQNKRFRSKNFFLKRQYWQREFLQPVQPLKLPVDHPRSAATGYAANEYCCEISRENTEALLRLSAEKQVTIYILMLTALNVFLYKLTGQSDICVGIPFAQRNNPQLERTVGSFLNTLVLRSYPDGNKSFSDYLKEVREISMRAYANSDYPLELLLEDLEYRREEGRNPLFDIIFNSQNVENISTGTGEAITGEGKLKFLPYKIESCSSPFDISFLIELFESRICFKLYYKTGLFGKSTIRYFMDEYLLLTEQILVSQELKLDDYSIFRVEHQKSKKIKIVNSKNEQT